jgi:hypothetical protein
MVRLFYVITREIDKEIFEKEKYNQILESSVGAVSSTPASHGRRSHKKQQHRTCRQLPQLSSECRSGTTCEKNIKI